MPLLVLLFVRQATAAQGMDDDMVVRIGVSE
jgi:hypothetical protein